MAEGAGIVHVVGARPNFVKMAPVIEALARRDDRPQLVVHTGQHYDERMSGEMFSDLELPTPDLFLGIGSGTHGAQTARALADFEQVLLERRPELVVVGGDVNSTLACALAAAKLGIPVAHVESGLRSGDWTMPEEINRVLTDRLSDFLFTHSPEAEGNLLSEGIASERIHPVGNTMIDSLRKFESKARDRRAWQPLGLREHEYVLITLHRPSNVDDPARLDLLVDQLCGLALRTPAVFPIHPRTRAQLEATGRLDELEAAGMRCIEPVGYLDFLSLQADAGAVLTDSGGVQEETSALGVRCYTLRPNTERPVTIELGTNVLLGDDPAAIERVELGATDRAPCRIPLWDGQAGERIAEVLNPVPHAIAGVGGS
ncbi:MAG TPA: UDP-N-acetylglucosamine 2-epimerase (non-hydrolyzing) [Thermoleophilaceae bacterium]|nr:UDP-N-acetylglucosamine 2-epimerase (non-hydrolyzing) [Thermoleophilaceae bacterium]